MNILVVGSGGREHALSWCLARSGHQVVAAPGNPGIALIAECVPVKADDLDGLVALAGERAFDLVVIGPEAPLVAGLADRLREDGVAVFGPSAAGAQLEGSKIFSKTFFARHGIRTAPFFACETMDQVDAALGQLGDRVVVKADGLAAGTGVVVCADAGEARAAAKEMIEQGRFGAAGRKVVVEQRLSGRELSVMAITDGSRYEVVAQAEDHKAIFDGDQGPNTGGMGTVSPAAWATPELIERIEREILDPTVRGLAADGIDYRGVLYAGLMVDDDGVPWLIEYNCRFGDPEAQVIMARVEGDLGAWFLGAARGELPEGHLAWDPRTAVCVVLASEGYPATPRTGDRIDGLDVVAGTDDLIAFHAGTAEKDGQLVTAGGRVLGVTALGEGLASARARAYHAARQIRFRGMQYRTDIGARQHPGETP
jgi:phosphoribosylamine---glycine ligase